jgi:hypothetical protein
MLELKDFYDDQLLLRQVKRATKQAAAAELDEDEDDYAGPRGTQSARPEQIDDDEDDDEGVDVEDRRRTIARVKRERQQSRDLSIAPKR